MTPFVYPNEGINIPVRKFINSMGDLTDKKALDCPTGDGRATFLLKAQGANVDSADLYPEFYKVDDEKCLYVDLADDLPFDDETYDFIICQEGIEHMQDQLGCLQEFHRVLKPNGRLLITTPSLSHLRAKLSHFFVESDYWKRQAPSELDSIWFSNKADNRMYFGHIFLLNIQKLRSLSVFSGFEILKFHPSEVGTTSLILAPIFYPFILLANTFSFFHSAVKSKYFKQPEKLKVAKEIFRLNCSLKTLVCKDFVVELKKSRSKQENASFLKKYSN